MTEALIARVDSVCEDREEGGRQGLEMNDMKPLGCRFAYYNSRSGVRPRVLRLTRVADE